MKTIIEELIEGLNVKLDRALEESIRKETKMALNTSEVLILRNAMKLYTEDYMRRRENAKTV